MKTFGLIGYPLKQSFSQKFFSEKFESEGMEARYLNFPITSIDEFNGLLKHHPYLAGLNVTIPYKELVIPYLDEINEVAKAIGAVNVIKFKHINNKTHLIGYNTDTIGFINSIKPLLKASHTKALILGTGGAAKSVAYSLKKLGITYRFVSRNPTEPSQVSYANLTSEILDTYHIIVNTSPIGMYPNIDEYPDIPYQHLSPDHLLYDVVYNPELTKFLELGAKQGATIKNGLEMLYIQAEESWKIWNSEN